MSVSPNRILFYLTGLNLNFEDGNWRFKRIIDKYSFTDVGQFVGETLFVDIWTAVFF